MAASLHLPDVEPKDIDVIAKNEESLSLISLGEKLPSPHRNMQRVKIGSTIIEIEIAESGSSGEELMKMNGYEVETPLGKMSLASVETLYLLKRSHVWHRHRFSKTFRDMKKLESYLKNWNDTYDRILQKRVTETVERLNYKDHHFDVSTSKFFNESVHRLIPHDEIHEMVKFNERPLYTYLKDDQSKAKVLYSKFLQLSHEMQIQNFQEECMALTIERRIIPSVLKKKSINYASATKSTLEELCYNYLPFEFRMDCIDNFDVILDTIPEKYWVPVLKKIGGIEP